MQTCLLVRISISVRKLMKRTNEELHRVFGPQFLTSEVNLSQITITTELLLIITITVTKITTKNSNSPGPVGSRAVGFGLLHVSQQAPVRGTKRCQRQGSCCCVQVEYCLWRQPRALQDGLQPFCLTRSQKSFLKCLLRAALGGGGRQGQHMLVRGWPNTPGHKDISLGVTGGLPSVRWVCICPCFVGGRCRVPAAAAS